MAKIIEIYVVNKKGEDPISVPTANAIEGKGLDGDRYANLEGSFSRFDGKRRHLSIIAKETIEKVRDEHNLTLPPGHHRRNVVVEGIELNSLLGKTLQLGDIRVRVDSPCAPCAYLEKKTQPGVLSAFKAAGGAGVRAEILESGTISVGDTISIPDGTPAHQP